MTNPSNTKPTRTDARNDSRPGSQLFDLVQRKDGTWAVWTRKSPAELGMVNRERIERARGEAYTDEAWAEFIRQAHFTEQSVWVIAATYPSRPAVDTVLALLRAKRRAKPAPRKEQPQAA